MKELNIKEKAIGAGITFPLNVTDGGVYPITGKESLITNNLRSLMLYPVGSRLRAEEYGNYFHSYIEEPNTQALNYIIKRHLLNLVNSHEPRVLTQRIESYTEKAKVSLRLHYQISDTPLQSYIDLYLEKTS